MVLKRSCIIAAITAILLFSTAFAFIGPGFDQLVKTIKVNPVENTVEIERVTPTPKPMATPLPTPEPTPEPTATPTPAPPAPPAPPEGAITCSPNAECGGLDYDHVIRVEASGLTQFDFKVKPHGSTDKIHIFTTSGGFFHKIAEKTVADPNAETTFTVVTNEDVSQIMISMPGSNRPWSQTLVTPLSDSDVLPMGAHTSLWSDTCGNNIGYSDNPSDSHCSTTDCCNWYQKYHVHDLGVNITQNVSINVDFKSGGSHGCKDNATISTSANNITWLQAGIFSLESIDTSKGGGPHQLWATTTYTISDYDNTFQYVKISIPRCYNDWSYVTVTDEPDNQPPTANFTAPDTALVHNPVPFNASGSSDSDGSVAFYEWQWGDGTLTNTSEPIIDHAYSNTGIYTVSLVVKDDDLAGDSVRKSINITVDNDAPGIMITTPVNETVFGYRNIGVYYNTTATDINYSLMMLDNGAYCPEPYNNTWNDTLGRQWCEDPNGSPTAFKALTDGWHVLHVRHVDYAGNRGPEDNVSAFINAGAPGVAISSPVNDSVTANNWMKVNFSTPDGDVAKFEYSVDDGPWEDTGITGISANITYFYNFTLLPKGVRSLRIRAWDASQSGEDYVRVNITSSLNSPPSVVINSPADRGYYLFVDEINFTATDPQQAFLNCSYKIDAGAWTNNINATNATPKTVAITNITAENTYTLYVKCDDGTYPSNTVEVDFTVDTTGPVTTITYPSEGANVTSAYFEYSASDQAGIDYYEIKNNTASWVVESGESHSFDLADGSHTLYVRAYDKLGNLGGAVNVNITVDTVAPQLSITAPANNTNTSLQSVGLMYSSASSDVKAFYQKLNDGPWVLDADGSPAAFPNVSDGTHYRYIKVVDWAGNEKILNNKINVDANGPTTYITAPTGSPEYSVDDINVTFYTNDSDISKFQYSFDGANWTDAVTSASNETEYTYEFNNVPEGVSKLYVRGVDASSNYGPAERVTVNVSSIFTNLAVSLVLPPSGISSTPFGALVFVRNYNEEDIPASQIKVNITTSCGISGTNPKTMAAIPAGNNSYKRWTLSCSTGLPNITGYMIYTPTGQTKKDEYTFTVKPMSGGGGEEEEEEGAVFEFFGVTIDLTENEVILSTTESLKTASDL